MKRLKYFLLVGLLAFAAPRPQAHAQMVTYDVMNWIQNFMTEVNSYTSAIANVAELERFGKLLDLMKTIKSVVQTGQKVLATARAVKSISDGNYWAIPGLARMWGVDPRIVGLSDQAVSAYAVTRTALEQGRISPYAITVYGRAYHAAHVYIKEERARMARERAAEAAQAATEGAKATEDLVGSDGGSTPESQTATAVKTMAVQNQVLVDATAAQSRVALERMGLEEVKEEIARQEEKEAFGERILHVGSLLKVE
jgi:hypothetical protein